MKHPIVCVPAIALAALAPLIWSTGCKDSNGGPAGPGPSGSSPGSSRSSAAPRRLGEHWVQNDQLKAVMAQVSSHAARWPAGVPDDPEAAQSPAQRADAEQAFREAAALADGLAEAAARIPRSVADHPMSDEDRRGFRAEAERLRVHALELRRAARARRVEPMQRSLDQISSSCVSCHSQYRDFTGELQARKASSR